MNHHGRQFLVTLAAGMATLVSSYAYAQSYGGYPDNRGHIVQRPQDASAEQNRPETPKAAQDRIHPDVYTKLQSSDDETIYVLVTLKAEIKEGTTPEQKKASIKKVRDKLLAKLAPRELDLVYQFETPGLLIARIDAAILTKLEDYPDVTGVIPSKIEMDVFTKLGSSDDGRVHVIVNLTPVEQGPPDLKRKKALVKEIQDRVFRNLAPGELKIRWRFEISGGFSGHINAAGLAKLAIHPDVVGVGVVGRGTVDLEEQQTPTAAQDRVHPDVRAKPRSRGYVAITLKPEIQKDATPQQQKAAIKKAQDQMLARMAAEEFKLVYRFKSTAMLVGHLKAAGLGKLNEDPIVVSVAPSKIKANVFAKLEGSDDGTVRVIVNVTPVTQGAPGSALRSTLVKQVQDRVLGKLKPSEFEIEWAFEISGGVSGNINAAGLAKLAAHPDVLLVRHSKVSPQVYRELKESEDGKALVVVSLGPVGPNASALEERMAAVKKIKDRVLGKLEPGEFDLVYEYEALAAMAGRVDASGLAKLAADAEVLSVGSDIRGELFNTGRIPSTGR